ncbi:hypothetical protein PflCFBP13517_25595 [Pseudomonas fluorescens]|nr:hypothetical protein PflCFBP13517_25595 [Pseudomonas fluorescens]
MVSLADVRRILGGSDHRQQACEQGLNTALRSLVPIEHELREIESQEESLRRLLATHGAENQSLSHAELLILLRRQAVIRRQIANLGLDHARVTAECEGITQDVKRLRETRKVLQKKHLKYQHLEQRLVRENSARVWRREENDIEELLVNSK